MEEDPPQYSFLNMRKAPWEGPQVSEKDLLFVLVTGANCGIGLGICKRLIDDFLTNRPQTSHLVLIPTARSDQKLRETGISLRRHTRHFAANSKTLIARARAQGQSFDPNLATRRVHILGIQLDLCDFVSVYAAADELANNTVSGYYGPDEENEFTRGKKTDEHAFELCRDVKISRLDAVVLNAGFGGFTGVKWGLAAYQFFRRGPIQAFTWPMFKAAECGTLITPIPGHEPASKADTLGSIFCTNVFGHYLLVHALVPMLRRPATSTLSNGRIIWVSSIEAQGDSFHLADFQARQIPAAYEHTKRLTDLLALSSSQPNAQPWVRSYLEGQTDLQDPSARLPVIYLCHPGVVQTTLFPLNAVLSFCLTLVLYITRWIGSLWHPVQPYLGAIAPVWLVLQDQSYLDEIKAERIKWGSSTSRWGAPHVRDTVVEGWGQCGVASEQPSVGEAEAMSDLGVTVALSADTGISVARKYGTRDATRESVEEFVTQGVQCWRDMEGLRIEWDTRVKEAFKSKHDYVKLTS